jgi:hypothetical protein
MAVVLIDEYIGKKHLLQALADKEYHSKEMD